MTHPNWEQRYVENNIPWETNKPDIHLQRLFGDLDISSGKAIEIGCGTGNNVIWLQQQGLETLGLDMSPTAISMAREKAKQQSSQAQFEVKNFLTEDIEDRFDFAYDRGCFHTFSDTETRSQFASRLAALLEPKGIWHSLIGSTDGPPRDFGPPRRSAAEICAAVEPYFEIQRLTAVTFDEGDHKQAKAWILVAQKREDTPPLEDAGEAKNGPKSSRTATSSERHK